MGVGWQERHAWVLYDPLGSLQPWHAPLDLGERIAGAIGERVRVAGAWAGVLGCWPVVLACPRIVIATISPHHIYHEFFRRQR